MNIKYLDLNNDYRFINFYKENLNILLYVANQTEFEETISFLCKNNKNIVSFVDNGNVYYIGKIGLYPIVVVKGGSIGQMRVNSCEPTINGSLKTFKNIKYLVTVGVCGGASTKVKIGDVVIANEIKDYESQKLQKETVIDRSQGIFNTELSNIIASNIGLMDFEEFDVHYGKIISGNKLVNSKSFSQQILNIHTEAIALDMEGYAMSRAAVANKLNDWLFIKAASDSLHNKNGSAGQARCVRHALQVLNKLFSIKGLFNTTKQKVLISGSFVFGDTNTKYVEELSYKLTQKLIDSNFKIVSGYGKCVGNAVVAGAYNSQSHLSERSSSIQDLIEIYPFPRVENTSIITCLENIKFENRQLMSKGCSFTIFVFGKKDNGESANGMEEEFRLAHNSFVVPVGATGYKALELWNRVYKDIFSYYPKSKQLKDIFLSLNDPTISLDMLIHRIINFINSIKNVYFSFN